MSNYRKARSHLSKDLVMKGIVERFGELEWGRSRGPFTDLTYSIIGQQLSGKVASTIFERFKALFGRKKITAKNILDLNVEDIRGSGISYSKVSYLKNLSEAVVSKELEINKFTEMKDEEVVENLIKTKGIGRWTAEMFLMFTLERQDVFSIGDLGLRKAVSVHYGVDKDDHKTIEKISLKWSPYRTWASRYLWKSLDEK